MENKLGREAAPTPGDVRVCDCGCGVRFVLTEAAPHKRFASRTCRERWHSDERRRGVEVLRGMKGAAAER